jgi:heptose I phosphotransferase
MQMGIWLDKEFELDFPNKQGLFEKIMSLEGEVFRKKEGRCTQHLSLNGNQYFIKHFSPLSWKTCIKSILSFKLYNLSTKNEFLALRRLKKIGVATPELIAYGYRHSLNPTKLRSFIMTKSLLDKTVPLTDFCSNWQQSPPSFQLKRNIVNQVATIAKKLHDNGIIHQDLYFHHLLLEMAPSGQDVKLYLIDLHRAFIKKQPRLRWLIKDLASLYCSSLFSSFSNNDIYRFLKKYYGMPLRKILDGNKEVLARIKKRGIKTYKMELEKKPLRAITKT